jgi:hypothetical protein
VSGAGQGRPEQCRAQLPPASPGARALLLHLADDTLPGGGEGEVARALGGVVGLLGDDDPVDAERALPAVGAGDEVPDLVLVDQAPRVDQALGPLAGAAGVRLPHLPPPDHRRLQPVYQLRAVPVPLAPARRIDHGGPGGGLRVGPEGLRQCPDQLAERGLGLAGDGRGRPDQQEQRLGLGCRQPAEVGAGAADQRPAAAPAGPRVDRDAGGGHRLQVPAGGGHGHLELAGQLGGGHPPAGLQQQEGGDETVGTHARLPQKVLSW